jgi:pyruvate ferredoxin oxidoreductase beta subunit
MAAHRIPYVATASVAYLLDFVRKVKRAAEVTQKGEGMAYLHVHSPCPTGWGFPTEKSVEVGRLAVQTGMWPLYEVDHGVLRITQTVKERKPVAEYLRAQRRFRHLAEEEIKKVQSYVDGRCLEIEGRQQQPK